MALALVALTPEGLAVRSGPVGPAVGIEVESPVGTVSQAMVAPAKSAHALRVAGTALGPEIDVVGVCPCRWGFAAGEHASTVAKVHRAHLV